MMLYSNACQLLSNLKEKGRLPLLIVAGTPPGSFLYPALTYTFSEVRTNGLFLHGTVVKRMHPAQLLTHAPSILPENLAPVSYWAMG